MFRSTTSSSIHSSPSRGLRFSVPVPTSANSVSSVLKSPPAAAVNLLPATPRSPLITNSFGIRTSANPAPNSRGMCSFKTQDLNSIRMCTYEKTPRGVPTHPLRCSSPFASETGQQHPSVTLVAVPFWNRLLDKGGVTRVKALGGQSSGYHRR
jgi:hypothetical protein